MAEEKELDLPAVMRDRREKLERLREFGLDHGINYTEVDADVPDPGQAGAGHIEHETGTGGAEHACRCVRRLRR